MAGMTFDRREQDLGNILLLEHVNVRVVDRLPCRRPTCRDSAMQQQRGRTEVVPAIAHIQYTVVLLSLRSPPPKVLLQDLRWREQQEQARHSVVRAGW